MSHRYICNDIETEISHFAGRSGVENTLVESIYLNKPFSNQSLVYLLCRLYLIKHGGPVHFKVVGS